jgi:Na+/H+-dicarboxylate symporter
MLWFTLGSVGGLALTGLAAIYAKQALIDWARTETNGYF